MVVTHPKVLLFDLGGVIVPWVGMIELSRLTGRSETELSRLAKRSNLFMSYEVGGCHTDEFLDELNRLFDLGKEQDELAPLWNEWVRPPYARMRQTLLGLKDNYTTACLSNTNASHWNYLAATHNIIDVFDYAYASHILKVAKPHSEAWELCLNDMGVDASDVWFFDDTQENIEAAQSLGIKSFHVDRTVGVIPTLKALGVLD
ncbi:MAG: HAD family phosphatase [Maricaulaceae bacterium]